MMASEKMVPNKGKNRVIMIAAFGDRATNVSRLVRNLRSFVDYPIIIITTRDSNIGGPYLFGGITRRYIDQKWAAETYRSGVRNSDWHKIDEVLRFVDCADRVDQAEYDSALLLDDDMLIVNKNFVDGFDLAEKFGAALPLNPRIYQIYELMGADVTSQDLKDLEGSPLFAPANNFSPFFVSLRDVRSVNWMHKIRCVLEEHVCRGTLAAWKASWSTGFTPVNLPMQWCVCGAEAQYIRDYTKRLKGCDISIPPIMLHLGHEETQSVFRELIDITINGEVTN